MTEQICVKSYLRLCMDEYPGIHNFTKISKDERSWSVQHILTDDSGAKMKVE